MRRILMMLAALLLFTSMEAKVGKIKYGKYIIYTGEVVDDVPSGEGILTLSDIKNKDIAYVTVSGRFNGNNVSEARLEATDYNALEFEGLITFELHGEKDKAMSIGLNLVRGTLYHDDIEYLYKRYMNIGITNLMIQFTADKEAKEWQVGFGANGQPTTSFQGCIPGMPFPKYANVLGFSKNKLKGFFADFSMTGVLVSAKDKGWYLFDDGSILRNDVMHFGNGDELQLLANNDWTGSMTYLDGTRISKDKTGNYDITFSNGDAYKGTLRHTTLDDLSRLRSDHPNFRYQDGVLTKGGEAENWINGETYSVRHARLLGIMRQELVDSIECGAITEAKATELEAQLQLEEKRHMEELVRKQQEFTSDSVKAVNNLYPGIMNAVKGKKFVGRVYPSDKESVSFSKKVQFWLSVSFVSATYCMVNYKGVAVAKDKATAEFISSMSKSFIVERNCIYRIENGKICLYNTGDFEKLPITLRFAKNKLSPVGFSGALTKK